MAALTVVEDLEKSEYRVRQFDPCPAILPIQLDLHARPEGFLSIELSQQSTIVPNEGISPEARILFVNAHDVNCTPWSACAIPPAAGWRFLIAMYRALTTRFESFALSIDQPTIYRGEATTT